MFHNYTHIFVCCYDHLITTAPLTDEAIIAAVREPVTEPCEESDDEDDTAPLQCPSHADMIAMCSQMTTHLEAQTDTHKYFSYVNNLQQFATNMQFNCKIQYHVTDFFV